MHFKTKRANNSRVCILSQKCNLSEDKTYIPHNSVALNCYLWFNNSYNFGITFYN